jgi:hypothetical protein
MMGRLASVALGLLTALGAIAGPTNTLSEAEIQGRQLAQQILEQRPAENFTNTGVLIVSNGEGKRSEFPVKCVVVTTETGWETSYTAEQCIQNSNEWNTCLTAIKVEHSGWLPDRYEKQVWSEQGVKSNNVAAISFTVDKNGTPVMHGATRSSATVAVTGEEIFTPFVGSDFWIADLGLEFFHWPEQKILKPYEMRRGRSCKVLESINPNPAPNGYSRVVSWIDNETLGIVQAEAYDAKGKLLKEFYPKDFKKVNEQWGMGEMEMINDQTGSRTWIKFDLKRHD